MYAAADAHSNNISFSSLETLLPSSVLLMQTDLDDAVSHNSCSIGSPPSPTTTTPNNPIFMMKRSLSTLLNNNNNGRGRTTDHLFEDPTVRRVYSTGDLQRINGMQHNHMDSPLSSESSIIIQGMSRVSPYSPQEKKVRIERYKIKRNQRNFNKKIKYACRKTLADRRPRIRGRFARNDEIEKNTTVHWSHIGGGMEEDENWVSIFDSIVAANLADHHSQPSSTFGLLY